MSLNEIMTRMSMDRTARSLSSQNPLHHISMMPGFGNEVASRALQDAVVDYRKASVHRSIAYRQGCMQRDH